MPWNTGGPGPWGSPGGTPGGSSGGGSNGGGSSGGGNDGGRPPPGGGPRGPWGSGGGPGGGPGGGQMPDLDQLIAQAQAFIRGLMGRTGGPRSGGPRIGRPGGGRGLALIGLAVAAFWLASGAYRVQPDEQGVVLRFGAYYERTGPGLNWHWPWPIERVETPAVTRVNRTEIGYRSTNTGRIESGPDQTGRDVSQESLMLTGDENIIDIDVAVFWKINDAAAYLFNTRDPNVIVRAVAESSMREVIGRTPIQPALTELRAQIETDVLRQTQQILNNYKAGIEITQVQLQKVDPPGAVIESFRDVQRANTDAERMRNEAQSYANDIVPRARGDAARLIAEAEGSRQATIALATGQTQRFISVLTAYRAAKDITLKRMYIETMQDILSHSSSIVVDDKLKGLVPFLSLTGQNPPGVAAPPGPSAAPATAASGNTQ
jgi:membrane protease subunit HflK